MRMLVIVAMLLLPRHLLSADDSLQDLIAALEQQEAHYANLQLELTNVYSLAEDAEVEVIPNAQQTLQSDKRIAFTVQGDQFRATRQPLHTLCWKTAHRKPLNASMGRLIATSGRIVPQRPIPMSKCGQGVGAWSPTSDPEPVESRAARICSYWRRVPRVCLCRPI